MTAYRCIKPQCPTNCWQCNHAIPESNEVAPEIHYCPGHSLIWREFRESGGVKRELENVVPYRKKVGNKEDTP